VLRGRDVQDYEELKRQGLSIRAISQLTGYCRKTVRKYLIQPDTVPVYGPRSKRPGRLEPFKPYLEDRMRAGVWNASRMRRQPGLEELSLRRRNRHVATRKLYLAECDRQCITEFPQLPIFLIAPRGVWSVPSLLTSKP